jgi:hypothetical protein
MTVRVVAVSGSKRSTKGCGPVVAQAVRAEITNVEEILLSFTLGLAWAALEWPFGLSIEPKM